MAMRCDTRFLFINRIHRHYSWKIKFKTKIKKFKSLNGLKIVGGYNWDMQSVKKKLLKLGMHSFKTLFKFYLRISLLIRGGAQIITLELLFLPSPQIFSVTTLSSYFL